MPRRWAISAGRAAARGPGGEGEFRCDSLGHIQTQEHRPCAQPAESTQEGSLGIAAGCERDQARVR